MPMKAPSLPQLLKLAQSKGCSVYKFKAWDNTYRYSITDITDNSNEMQLATFRNGTTITDTELRRGIKGFLDAL